MTSNTVVALLVGNTAVAIGLTLAALLAGLLRRPAVAHALWVVVLIKLITPPVVRVPVRWTATPQQASPAAVMVNKPAPTGLASAVAPTSVTPRPPPARMGTVAIANAPTPVRATARQEPSRRPIRVEPFQMVLAIWLGGSLLYAAIAAARWRRLRRLIRQAAMAGDDFVRLVDDVAARVGLGRPPDVRVVPHGRCCSPMVFGLRRPILIVPAALTDEFSIDRQRAIIAHELAHLRRGDQWVRLLELVATPALWWHPLLWLARRGLHEAEEQCCDAWVIALMPDSRREYADALVDVLQSLCTADPPAPVLVGATGLGRMTHLRRRLTMIVHETPPKSLSLVGRMLIVLVLLVLPLAPVRAADDPPKTATTAAHPASAAVVDDSARKAVTSLLEMAQDSGNPPVQEAGRNAIVRFGPKAVPVLIEALGRDEKSAAAAQQLLPAMGTEAIEALIDSVDATESSAIVRERALATLETVLTPNSNRGAGGAGVPGMEGGPMGPSFASGGAYPIATPRMMSVASWVIAPAAKASSDASPTVRRAAVRVLGAASCMVVDPAIAPALGAALKDEDSPVRRVAAEAMVNVARFTPESAGALAALSAAVNDADQEVRLSALTALAAAGPAARELMPAVVAALKDANPQVRIAAANALGAMQASTQAPQPGQVQLSGQLDITPGGFVPSSPQGDAGVWVGAENVWHWAKLGRYDLAKVEADKLLKLQANPAVVWGAFVQVAQSRNEDLAGWLRRTKDVKELKQLVGQLNETLEQINLKDQRERGQIH